MRSFFGVAKFIGSIFFLLLTITTANYQSTLDERSEIEPLPFSNRQSIYVLAACLYFLYGIYLAYSALAELRPTDMKPKPVVLIGVALGLTVTLETYYFTIGNNKLLALFSLSISVCDLIFVNRKKTSK